MISRLRLAFIAALAPVIIASPGRVWAVAFFRPGLVPIARGSSVMSLLPSTTKLLAARAVNSSPRCHARVVYIIDQCGIDIISKGSWRSKQRRDASRAFFRRSRLDVAAKRRTFQQQRRQQFLAH